MGKLFGTDGIRGVANSELTPEMALKMGRIVAALLKKEKKAKNSFFLLGRDTRISGNMLEGALVAGINSSGVDVRLLGVISTPGVAYLIRRLGALGGVMVSASHNPVEDNGIKFFDSRGFKLSDLLEEKAEKLYFQGEGCYCRPVGKEIGRAYRSERAAAEYLSFLRDLSLPLDGLKVVVDCANGSLSRLAPILFRKLGADVVPICCSPNGLNINLNCGSTNPALLQKTVKERKALVGLAFDGDGDRLIAVDELGNIVDGDAILAICASYFKEKNLLPHDTIVVTVMSNGGLEIAGEKHGFKVVRTKVGDRYVLEEMQRGGYALGGEQSGHIIFSDYLPTGDGLLTSLMLLRVMQEREKPLSMLAGIIQRLPQKLVNCKVKEKDGWEKNPRINEAIKMAEKRLGKRGRILVRASGTEPLIRIMLEGESQSLIDEISEEVALTVKEELSAE